MEDQQELSKKFRGVYKTWSSEPLTDDMVAEVLNIASNNQRYFNSLRDPALFMILATIGVRVSQITTMRLSDMVDAGDYVEYHIHLLKDNKLNNERKPSVKRVSKERVIGGLNHYNTVAKWLNIHNGKSEYLFYSNQQTKLCDKTINFLCCNLSKQIGAHIKPHSFRHYVATNIATKYGIERAAVALDHADIHTTQRYINPSALTINM